MTLSASQRVVLREKINAKRRSQVSGDLEPRRDPVTGATIAISCTRCGWSRDPVLDAELAAFALIDHLKECK